MALSGPSDKISIQSLADKRRESLPSFIPTIQGGESCLHKFFNIFHLFFPILPWHASHAFTELSIVRWHLQSPSSTLVT